MAATVTGRADLRLVSADGERLAAVHLPRPGGDVAVVVAHGFGGSLRSPGLRAVTEALSPYAGVVAFDFRGHGRSSGLTTMGDREVLDVDAAVAAARRLGYARVVTCGWSMGGSTVLRHAALGADAGNGDGVRQRVDAVVSVSAASRWYVRDTVPMRRLHWLVERPAGRVVTRVALRTRVARGWDVVPESPVEVVGRIAPTPLLLVHGDRDGYFPVEHPQTLAAAAGEPTELWLVEGFGHAEAAASPELLDRIGRHLEVLLGRVVAAGSG